jgi:U3 small nucleolar RNA-associated protein 7
MCLNPHNAVVCLGHSKGIVTMWTPNVKEPVAKMLAHRQPVTAVTIDR